MKQKKRPPGWTETGRDKGGYEIPYQQGHSITSRTETQDRILSLLRSGSENALTLRDIRSQTGFDGRRVRLAIREARLRGVPVVSDNESGYWLSDSPDEIRRFANSMRHRAREIAAVAAAVEKGASV